MAGRSAGGAANSDRLKVKRVAAEAQRDEQAVDAAAQHSSPGV